MHRYFEISKKSITPAIPIRVVVAFNPSNKSDRFLHYLPIAKFKDIFYNEHLIVTEEKLMVENSVINAGADYRIDSLHPEIFKFFKEVLGYE